MYCSQELHKAVGRGTLLGVGWALGYMLVGLGARALFLVRASRPLPADASEEGPVQPVPAWPFWQSLLPFLVLPALIVLLGYTIASDTLNPLQGGVFLGTAAFMGLLILRQVFVIRETIGQNHKLWEMHDRVTKAELPRERPKPISVERILAP